MAERAKPPAKRKQAASAADAGANDLDVLHPDRPVTIAGREVVVREYGFIEGLKLRPLLQPLLDDLHTLAQSGGLPELEHILALLGEHAEAVAEAASVAANVELSWVEGLSQDDGYLLLMLWWGANGPFFIRSVYQRIATEKAVAIQRAGATSTPT